MESQPARWWRAAADGSVFCRLCPRQCSIAVSQSGFCGVRRNDQGRLVSLAYGHPMALHADPIEKKPLFHFYPGTRIFSLGTAGCNLACRFCQNWQLSRARADRLDSDSDYVSPQAVISMALAQGCRSIAFTYNEPSIWAEYVVDIARLARPAGLKTVMVSNGYMQLEALADVYQWIDAANIDLKACCEFFYQRMTAAHLEPVLEALRYLRQHTAVWLEVTNLIIPGQNSEAEDMRRLAGWICRELGADTPVHFSAFHPDYRLLETPGTPPELLELARAHAQQEGLRFVYLGNVRGRGEETICPTCRKSVIRRAGYHLLGNSLSADGCCPCGQRIAGHF